MHVGGIVGFTEGSTIEKSSAHISITGSSLLGGLVGYTEKGILSESYATGNVEGAFHLGGLIGGSVDGIVRNSYASGEVTSTIYQDLNPGNATGGLIGKLVGTTIINSYAVGLVTGNFVGGFIGYLEKSPIITFSFFDIATTKQDSPYPDQSSLHSESSIPAVLPLTKADITATSFTNWDPDIWNFEEKKWPTLKNNPPHL